MKTSAQYAYNKAAARNNNSNSRLDYFKNNIIDANDQDFDPSQYMYRKDEYDEEELPSPAPDQYIVAGHEDPEDWTLQQQQHAISSNAPNAWQKAPLIVPNKNMSQPNFVSNQPNQQQGRFAQQMMHQAPMNVQQQQQPAQAWNGNLINGPSLQQQNLRQLNAAVANNNRQGLTIQTAPNNGAQFNNQNPSPLLSPLRQQSPAPNNQAASGLQSPLRGQMQQQLLQQQQQQQQQPEYRPSNQILAMIKGNQPQQIGVNQMPMNPMMQQQAQYGQFSNARMPMDNIGGMPQVLRSTTPPNQIPSLNDQLGMGAASFQGLGLNDAVYGQSQQQPPKQKSDERFGLLGLLNVIKMQDQDLNALALGFDLTSFGLNLNASEFLYPTFASAWNDGPARIIPEFKLATCYQLPQSVPLKNSHFQKFQDETLFYIFYSMPRDVLQLVAAKELMVRKWKFVKDLKLWFKKEGPAETVQGPNNTLLERGPFLYFDVSSWSKKQTKPDFNIDISKVWHNEQ